MDMRRWVSVFILAVVFQLGLVFFSQANMVFNVQHKFAGQQRNLSAYKAHDSLRHARILSDIRIPLGGNGHPTEAGLYFAKIGLGNPSTDFFVQVDTGSDILWVNCINCDKCPTKSGLGIKLTLYDPQSSSSSERIFCNDAFCKATYNGVIRGCTSTLPCQYSVVYGDGSSTAGFFVKDTLHFDKVTGDLQTSSANGSVIFGCGAVQSGELGTSSEALDGILGFGQANSSMISQLAAAGVVKPMFSHCLDNENGGGIFAIGEVVSPKVATTPIVPNQMHYNVILKEIEVGGNALDLPSDVFQSGDGRGAIIDSGTTLAYLPEVVYDSLMSEIGNLRPGLNLHIVEDQFICFEHDSTVDKDFPAVKFHFQGSLMMTIYPHDYLFQIREHVWCYGWQNSSTQSKDGRDMTLLGDMLLSNKLIVYDLENQTIGWAEYNCSSSIKVKDDSSEAVYKVAGQYISSASQLITRRVATLVLPLVAAVLHRYT